MEHGYDQLLAPFHAYQFVLKFIISMAVNMSAVSIMYFKKIQQCGFKKKKKNNDFKRTEGTIASSLC